jgi:hypothetical protein
MQIAIFPLRNRNLDFSDAMFGGTQKKAPFFGPTSNVGKTGRPSRAHVVWTRPIGWKGIAVTRSPPGAIVPTHPIQRDFGPNPSSETSRAIMCRGVIRIAIRAPMPPDPTLKHTAFLRRDDGVVGFVSLPDAFL